jgi:hypothetical protein
MTKNTQEGGGRPLQFGLQKKNIVQKPLLLKKNLVQKPLLLKINIVQKPLLF